MKVKITRGYYGYRKNGKASELKDVNSPAFELDEQEAERIIGLGIAKAVSVSANENENMLTGHLTEDQLRTLPYSKLKQLCKELGVSAVGKQDELIARLVAVEVQAPKQDEEDVDDSTSSNSDVDEDKLETDDSEGDLPPELKAAEPEEQYDD